MWNETFPGTRLFGEPLSDAELLTIVGEALRARLPGSWRVETRPLSATKWPDATLVITSPDGTSVTITVETKRRLEPKDVTLLLARRDRGSTGEPLLIAAPFLGPRTRDLLHHAGMNYADATGNLRLELRKPTLFIALQGGDANPWREVRPLHSLKGPAAGRIVRALCDFRPPFGIRALAEHAKTSMASTSRVVALLDREALLTKVGRGEVVHVEWGQLIRRWAVDYSLTGSNTIRTFLEPRGLDVLLDKLRGVDRAYAITGTLAASVLAPLAPSRLATIYVEEIDKVAAQLRLRRVESGTNVLLAEPFDAVVFERVRRQDGLAYVAPTQAVADLLTSPGRGPAEGEELLRWMEENEDVWRS